MEDVIVLECGADEAGPMGKFEAPAKMDSIPSELNEQLGAMLKAVRKVSASVVPLDKREEIAREVILNVVQARLKEYGTSYTQDVKLLKDPSTAGRLRLAVMVRSGEKKVLRDIVQLLRKTARDVEKEANPPPAKKAKTSKS